ncbi:MAG: hypothetical protein IIW02_01570 [Clostridia bacterium]|nr:hypothetical protein [Clostridia bacterium]
MFWSSLYVGSPGKCRSFPAYRNPAGSLIGCIEARTAEQFNVYNCYATGTVTNEKVCTSKRTILSY